MITIASRTIKISDISGEEMPEEQAARIVIRKHPIADTQREIDLTPEEASTFRVREDWVVMTLHLPGQQPKDITIPVADFRKVVGDDVVRSAKGVRGRVPGNGPR